MAGCLMPASLSSAAALGPDADSDALAVAEDAKRVILLRWVARALRRASYPPRAARQRREFHATAVTALGRTAVEVFNRRSESVLRACPPQARVLVRDATLCRRVARGVLHDTFTACRWLPKVRVRWLCT